MPDFEFEAKGLAELQRAMDELPQKLEKNLVRGAIRAAAKPIADDAKARVPVLQIPDGRRIAGALKRSIRARGVNYRGGRLTGGVTAGGSDKSSKKADTFYARFVEFGTAKMAARPFLRPAIASRTPASIEAFAAYIRERLSTMFVGQSWWRL